MIPWGKNLNYILKILGIKRVNDLWNSYELNELGDVKGKSLLHLQCYFGQDTLIWSRLGAACTEIDLSDKAIMVAQNLNNELGLDVNFIECNLYDVPKTVKGEFDIFFILWCNRLVVKFKNKGRNNCK